MHLQTNTMLHLPTDETISLKIVSWFMLLVYSEDKLKWFQTAGHSSEKVQEANYKIVFSSYSGKKENT